MSVSQQPHNADGRPGQPGRGQNGAASTTPGVQSAGRDSAGAHETYSEIVHPAADSRPAAADSRANTDSNAGSGPLRRTARMSESVSPRAAASRQPAPRDPAFDRPDKLPVRSAAALHAPVSYPHQNINVSVRGRWASVLGGALLALGGWRRSGFTRTITVLGGALLVRRGLSGHCEIYHALNINPVAGKRPLDGLHTITLHQTYTINRSCADLYQFWNRLENLPLFMHHLISVTVLDARHSHWKARGVLGKEVEWDAEITAQIADNLLAWRSTSGTVANAGSVRFRPAPAGRGSKVEVKLEYAPVGGAPGARIASWLGANPERQIRADLRHFKQLMEAGEIPVIKGQPTGPAHPSVTRHARLGAGQ